jgi:hypothetical protein
MCVLALVLEMPSKLPLKPQTPALHYAEINKAAQQSREPEQQEIVKRPIQTTGQHLPPPQELGPVALRRKGKHRPIRSLLGQGSRARAGACWRAASAGWAVA